MMHSEVSTITGAGPLTGIVLSFAGLTGFVYTKAIDFFGGAGHLVASTSSVADEHAQFVYGAMVIAGAMVSGWSFIQGRINDNRRSEERKDAQNRIDIHMMEQKAALEIQRERLDRIDASTNRQNEVLARQDATLAAIHQAVSTTPSPPAVVIAPAEKS